MSEPFLGEIKIFGFDWPPRQWARCDGQILPIQQYQSLYSLLGTTYGGDGRTTFGLPELRGRATLHLGPGYDLGQKSGTETVVLTAAQIPSHTHTMEATDADGTTGSPQGAMYAGAASGLGNVYSDATATLDRNLNTSAIGTTGGQPHENMMPWLAINFCIALAGLFPSRN